MQKLIVAVLFLVALPIAAQQANINAPTAGPTATKIVIRDFNVARDCACASIYVEYQDASSNALRADNITIPSANFPTATLQGLLGAMEVARSGETGIASRKMNFRVLGYLSDNGALTGVTLVP